MKSIYLILFSMFLTSALSGQVVITPGANLYLTGNAQLTLQNSSFVNNGGFFTANGRVTFTGTANSSISGTQPTQFYNLELNKSPGSFVSLQRSIAVSNQIIFTSGLLELNGYDTDLGSTGSLQGESENSRVTGNGGGQVIFSTVLNAPAGVNPANLGAIISSSENLGTVTIRRGHQLQTGGGMPGSILRYYDISTSTLSDLNATLRMNYFDTQLNGINEQSLVFYKTDDGINWLPQGYSSRNATENFVEKTGIASFRRWTLSGAGNALPVQFILFNISCEAGKAVIIWKTAKEQNSSRFEVEKSTDGVQWTSIASVPAAGNSGSEKSYSFIENNPVQNSYYRIVGYDLDGKKQYTSILRSSCNAADVFKLWPNPSTRVVFINIVTNAASTAMIRVFDSKGALRKEQKVPVLRGSNQFSVDLGGLTSGVYSVYAEWDNGQMKKTVSVLKQ
ncbi:MAG TPA: T9SS type A sorting domain-containing protein [Chitinophagaceae bacterium]